MWMRMCICRQANNLKILIKNVNMSFSVHIQDKELWQFKSLKIGRWKMKYTARMIAAQL